MPVPTSSLIFALAAALPFGLAIKDTVTGKYDDQRMSWGVEMPDDDAADELERFGEAQIREQALEAFRTRHSALEQAQREVELANDKARLRESFEGVFGAEVATTGKRFESLALGGSKGATDLSALWPGHDVALLDDGATTRTMFIRVDSDPEVCETLGEAITAAWGIDHTEDSLKIWVNHAIGQRAILESRSSCSLTFEKIVPLDSWLAKTPAAVVPMAIIGRPVKQLRDALGARNVTTNDDGTLSWIASGFGTGSGTTTMTANIKAGRVVGLLATATIDEPTQDLLVGRITALVGKEPTVPPEGVDGPLVWKTTPKITLEAGSQIFLRIGEQRD